ncbi:hypothetical protein DEM27_16215 [Metarhizobium album]|uniref:Uncharacterized protein n=2 Tax=Metarhizobium album TaxID=2182425 RepID=A0A2U2DNX0_9HYPH|nr:hypothetical protein DEM27_16215 [Rhizobium album]
MFISEYGSPYKDIVYPYIYEVNDIFDITIIDTPFLSEYGEYKSDMGNACGIEFSINFYITNKHDETKRIDELKINIPFSNTIGEAASMLAMPDEVKFYNSLSDYKKEDNFTKMPIVIKKYEKLYVKGKYIAILVNHTYTNYTYAGHCDIIEDGDKRMDMLDKAIGGVPTIVGNKDASRPVNINRFSSKGDHKLILLMKINNGRYYGNINSKFAYMDLN